MDSKQKDYEEFAKALKRLPPPVSCFANGGVCPWCGKLHSTITFGRNECTECQRKFSFGYPDWHEGKDPISWVDFPWREFEAVGESASALPEWKPNDRLRDIYFSKAEERLGSYADTTKPQ